MHSFILSVLSCFIFAFFPLPAAAAGVVCYIAIIAYAVYALKTSFENEMFNRRTQRKPNRVMMHERTAYCDALFWEIAKSFVPDSPRKDAESTAYDLVFRKGQANTPDCVLYLRIDPEECLRRKNIRGRACEEGVTELTYLEKLGAAHDVLYGPDSELSDAVVKLSDLVSTTAAEAILKHRVSLIANLPEPVITCIDEFEARVMHALEQREPLRCAVVGNIAAGKSTLIKCLQERFGDSVKQVQEPVDDWSTLLNFYNREPAEGAFPLQMCALQTRILDWSK